MSNTFAIGTIRWLGLLVAFVAGVLCAGVVRDLAFAVRGETETNCLSKTVCVGHDAQDALLSLSIKSPIGGLIAIRCQRANGLESIGLKDVVSGISCPSESYTLVFEDSAQITFITVENDAVSKISRVSARSFDP